MLNYIRYKLAARRMQQTESTEKAANATNLEISQHDEVVQVL